MGEIVRYPEYQETNVEWLGKIPSHWRTLRLKYVCNVQTGDKGTENAVEDGRYPFFVRSQTVERLDSYSHDCEAVLTAGDGVGVGKVFHYYDGPFSFHQRVYMLNNFRNVQGRFIYYYLKENFFKVALEGNAKSTVDSLRMPLFLNFIVATPPLPEQRAIARFLDHKTAQIDALIAKKQALLAKLAAKRTALISHAVTKGLDPDVEMKASGIEWLGEIPAHWEVLSLKYAVTFQRGHDLPAEHRVEGSVPLVSSSGVSGRHDQAKASAPGIVTGRYGTIGQFTYVEEDYWPLNTTLYSINTHENNVKFLWYMMHNLSDLFVLNSQKSAVPGVDRNDLHPIPTALPPVIEGQAVKVQQAIDKLKDYRTALITHAVTGKIDVRTVPVPEPSALEALPCES